MTTNGSLATHELLSEIFEAGLDSIKFSINAGTPETYKKIPGADDFEKVMKALRFAAEWKIKHNPDLKNLGQSFFLWDKREIESAPCK